jgi:hypothetical protein
MPIMAPCLHSALRGRPRSSSTMSHIAILFPIGGLTTMTSVTILVHVNVTPDIVTCSVLLRKTYSSSSGGADELGHVMVPPRRSSRRLRQLWLPP